MLMLLTGCVLGVVQGIRHAFEPDHLAAVSTMVAEQRSARTSVVYAAAWGAGHALVLTLVGAALFVLRATMPERLGNLFELLVGIMLITLGVRTLHRAVVTRRGGPMVAHVHGVISHRHGGDPDHVHLRRWTLARRPLLVGIVHGLAGSGALTAMVVARCSSMADGILFITLYGAGATLGMAVLAGVAGAPLARLARMRMGRPVLLAITGILSLGLGLVWSFSAAVRVGGG